MPADQEQHSEDRWLRALSELPRPELSGARQAQLTAVLRDALVSHKLSRSQRWYALIERWVEPSLVISCSGLVLVRLAMVLVRYLSNA